MNQQIMESQPIGGGSGSPATGWQAQLVPGSTLPSGGTLTVYAICSS
jgi:hypothetical protein